MLHLIVTRFNLPLWPKDKFNAPTRTPAWLESRFALFERYTLPSVKAQTCKEFKWFCLFDRDTPEPYLQRIERYREELPQLHPCFLDYDQAHDLSGYLTEILWGGEFSQFLSGPKDYLITTRLDNDDAIHCRMIERLQQLIGEEQPKKPLVFNFYYGYQYFERFNLLVRVPYACNHFLTLVEPGDHFVTAMKYDHTRIDRSCQVKNIYDTDPIYWIESVHGNNVDNDIRLSTHIRPRMTPADLSCYGITRQISRKDSIMGSFIYLPLQLVRKVIRRLPAKIRQTIRN